MTRSRNSRENLTWSSPAMQHRSGVVLLYAIGVLIIIGAVTLGGLESASASQGSTDVLNSRLLALDAAASGASYATGYVRYLVHLVNLRERGLNGAEYPGAQIEPWAGDRVAAVPGQPSADPSSVRFTYGQICVPGTTRPKYTLTFRLRLNESLLRNRYLLSGLESRWSPYAPAAYPEQPEQILYRIQSIGEVFGCDPLTGATATIPVAKEELRLAFNVRLSEIDIERATGTFEMVTRYGELALPGPPPGFPGGDPDGF